jgi:hypothetical protein
MGLVKIKFREFQLRPKTQQLKQFGGCWHSSGEDWWITINEASLEAFEKWYEGRFDVLGYLPAKPATKKTTPNRAENIITGITGITDLSDLIAAISWEFGRIGLEIPARKELTINRYGHSSQFLTEAEMRDYLSHLKTFPDDKSEPSVSPCQGETPHAEGSSKRHLSQKGLLNQIKQYLWEKGPKDAIPTHKDGSVDEVGFTAMAAKLLKTPQQLPEYIRTVL